MAAAGGEGIGAAEVVRGVSDLVNEGHISQVSALQHRA